MSSAAENAYFLPVRVLRARGRRRALDGATNSVHHFHFLGAQDPSHSKSHPRYIFHSPLVYHFQDIFLSSSVVYALALPAAWWLLASGGPKRGKRATRDRPQQQFHSHTQRPHRRWRTRPSRISASRSHAQKAILTALARTHYSFLSKRHHHH